jgi:hypothetical protein
MKKLFFIAVMSLAIATSGCKGNGSTGADSDASSADTTQGLNDGTGAPGSGTGSAGAGTTGDTTVTPQDTVNGAQRSKQLDTSRHQ